MKTILKYLAVFVAALLVFGTARYLDSRTTQDLQPSAITAETEKPVPQESTAPESLPEETQLTVETEPEPMRIMMTFAGDCTLGCHTEHTRAGYGFILTVGEDYAYPFQNVISWFENDDFTMVNLEGVLGERGAPAGKRYAFRGPSDYVNILTENSVEAVSLANNHSLDYGETGYAETKRLLEEAGVPYVEQNNSTVVTLENGVTVGIYGTVYNSIDPKAMVTGIAALKAQGADIVIYAPHWGTEHSFRPTQEQMELGHAAIDAGADIVYGCHPHVLQPIEEYNGGVIYYSLGNFSFGGNIYPSDYDTALIQQEIILELDGTVTLGERTIVPCSLSSIENRNNYQPIPYAQGTEEYDRVIRKLNGTFEGANLPIH